MTFRSAATNSFSKKNLSLRKKKRKEKKRKEKRKRGRRKKIKRKKNSLEARFDRVFKRRPKRQEKEFDTALSRDSLTSLADKRDFFQRGTNRRLCTRKLYPFVALWQLFFNLFVPRCSLVYSAFATNYVTRNFKFATLSSSERTSLSFSLSLFPIQYPPP